MNYVIENISNFFGIYIILYYILRKKWYKVVFFRNVFSGCLDNISKDLIIYFL